MDLDRIFKAYDVRGVFPDELDEEVAHRAGRAFAVLTGARRVIVARDMRASSEPLSNAFISGALSQGADVLDIGMASTDTMYFASGKLQMPGAVFTASHNPARYNGIKMCREGAVPVGQDTGLAEIKGMVAANEFGRPRRLGSLERRDMLDEYVDHVLGFVDAGAISGLSVVADAANGMAGLTVPAVFARLPVRLVPMYFELDGTFPNHPADPIQPENLEDLRRATLAESADVGLAFDGDADRVFIVDERAEPVSGSLTAALVASAILERTPGETVLHSLICSRVVPETIRAAGGTPVRTRVGHSFIKAVMGETGAVFGAEHSGHYYFRENWRADSGLIAALHVLEVLARAGRPLSEVLTPFKRYWNSGEINTEVADQQATVEAIARAHAAGAQDRMDGLTVEYDDWWFNVRASNTEPLLRLNVEAAGEAEGRARTEELLSLIR